jgi:hypothetical protein
VPAPPQPATVNASSTTAAPRIARDASAPPVTRP